jgi:hypothetical protein
MTLDVILTALKNRYVHLAAVAVIGCLIGFNLRSAPKTELIEKTVEVKVLDEETLQKRLSEEQEKWKKNVREIKTVRVITKADGSKEEFSQTEMETKEEKQTAKIEKEEKQEKKRQEESKFTYIEKKTEQASARYSIGVTVHKPVESIMKTKPLDNVDYSVKAGVKVVDPVWVELGYRIKEKSISLGAAIQF